MVLNYIGSKLSLLNFIQFVVNKEIKGKIKVVGDLFAGTGVVGLHFKKRGYKIIANDIQYYSYVINKKFLGTNYVLKFNGLTKEFSQLKIKKGKKRIYLLLDILNNIQDRTKGFIYNNYSLCGTEEATYKRSYFSDENALIIDSLRKKIEEWHLKKKLQEDEYFYLLGTLLEASDKVANTASVYGAFLKELKFSARKKLKLEYNPIFLSRKKNKVYNKDILEILNLNKIDLLYLDPPYNNRQYAPNYHILETIAKYDSPKISGKTGMREYTYQKSNFCIKGKVLDEFKRIVEKTNAKYILLSYNNEGLMSIKDIQKVLSIRGKPKTYKLLYKRFKADKTENRNHKANFTYEYLHFVKCEHPTMKPLEEYETPIIEVKKEELITNN